MELFLSDLTKVESEGVCPTVAAGIVGQMEDCSMLLDRAVDEQLGSVSNAARKCCSRLSSPLDAAIFHYLSCSEAKA